jgi:acyl-CoA dehydrogenase
MFPDQTCRAAACPMSDVESEEFSLLSRSIESCLAELCTPDLYEAAQRGEIPDAAWRQVEEIGLPLLFVDEGHGGLGLLAAQSFALLKLAGRFGAPLPVAETALANGVLASADLELASGPAAIIPQSNALRLGNNFVAGGAERIAWGAAAVTWVIDFYGRIARCSDVKATSGQSSIAGFPRDLVEFDGAADVAGYDGLPVQVLGAAARCMQMAGALERILELTTQYVMERHQFGRPLAKFQAVQQQLAILAAEAAAASCAADYVANSTGCGKDKAVLAVAAARARIGEAASRGAAIAHQLHGAIGFTQEYELQRLTRAIWTWRDEFGSQRYWTLRVAERAFDEDADEFWPMIVAA